VNLFRGLRPLQRAVALRDALAGVAMAAMDIPQVLGYSKIAGMPVVTGLYPLLLPLVAFAAFGSSRYLVVGAEAMTHLDYTAARIVQGLKKSLTEAGVELAFARVPWDLRSDFDRHHVTEVIGPDRFFNRLHDAIAAFEG